MLHAILVFHLPAGRLGGVRRAGGSVTVEVNPVQRDRGRVSVEQFHRQRDLKIAVLQRNFLILTDDARLRVVGTFLAERVSCTRVRNVTREPLSAVLATDHSTVILLELTLNDSSPA